MNNREKLLEFILSLTDEEAEKIVAFLKGKENPTCSGKDAE